MIYTNGTLPKSLDPWDVVILFPPSGRPPLSFICHPLPCPRIMLRMPAAWLPNRPPWRFDDPMRTLRELAEDFGSSPEHEARVAEALRAVGRKRPSRDIYRVLRGLPVAERVGGRLWFYDKPAPPDSIRYQDLLTVGDPEKECVGVQHLLREDGRGECGGPAALGWGSPSLFLRFGANRCGRCEVAARKIVARH